MAGGDREGEQSVGGEALADLPQVQAAGVRLEAVVNRVRLQ
jgi:hypothetical protein